MPKDTTGNVGSSPKANPGNPFLHLLARPSQPGDDWLRLLYSSYSKRMLANNERIWSSASILIPLSLAGFAALAAIGEQQTWKTVVLGFASSSAMWIWNIIAENHRAFQEGARRRLDDIEAAIGLPTIPQKHHLDRLSRFLVASGAVRRLRWALAIGVTLTWVILVLIQASRRC